MAFSDLAFLFGVFPVIFLIHALMPQKWRDFLLLFFSRGTAEYLILMICLILFNYFRGCVYHRLKLTAIPANGFSAVL